MSHVEETPWRHQTVTALDLNSRGSEVDSAVWDRNCYEHAVWSATIG
jgi:hypothetical protein